MLEKELEKKFAEEVKVVGGRAFKFVSPGNTGVPDRIVVMPGGKIGFVELKQKGKKPTKLQSLQIKRLKELGCFVAVLDDDENIGEILENINRFGR